jgi:AAA+ superfamily predicted ATPase
VRTVLENRLNAFRPTRISWTKVSDAARGLSQADISRAADEVIKQAILEDSRIISTDELVSALRERRAIRETVSGIVDS